MHLTVLRLSRECQEPENLTGIALVSIWWKLLPSYARLRALPAQAVSVRGFLYSIVNSAMGRSVTQSAPRDNAERSHSLRARRLVVILALKASVGELAARSHKRLQKEAHEHRGPHFP